MLIELTEVLRCPRCPSTAGLVALIGRAEGDRVVEGSLGCPFCEARYPIRAREADLSTAGGSSLGGHADEPETGSASLAGLDSSPAERALALAALLGLEGDARGYVLLDEKLAPLAERVAQFAPQRHVATLVASRDSDTEQGSTPPPDATEPMASRVRVDVKAPLPVLDGRLSGVALVRPDLDRLSGAARALREGGRLVVFDPDAELPRRVEETGLRVLAADERAVVAVREVISG